MVEMGCAEHDQLAASTQFMTHTVGRVLGEMQLQPTAIDTRGYQSLLDLVDNTTNDSFDLYYGLFMYNQVGALIPPQMATPARSSQSDGHYSSTIVYPHISKYHQVGIVPSINCFVG